MDFSIYHLAFKESKSCEKISTCREEQVGKRNLLTIRLGVEHCLTGIAVSGVIVAQLPYIEMLFTAWQH